MTGKKLKVMGVSALSLLAISGIASAGAYAQTQHKKAPVVLEYACWGDSNTMAADVKEFNATHPGIVVKLSSVDAYDINHLAAAAAAGKFPDVLWIRDVPYAVAHGWALDLTPYLKNDPTYKTKIFANLWQITNYYGHQFALPTQLYLSGIAINKTLFKQANVPLPKPNWTIQEFRRDGIKLTDYSKHQFGLMGVSGADVLGFRNCIIPTFGSNLGEQAMKLSGGGYDFTNPAFAKAQNFVSQILYTDKSNADLYYGPLWDKWYGKGKDPWAEGKIAMMYAHSWDFPYLNSLHIDWEFLPLPKGTVQRLPLAVEEMIVSRTTKHPKEAVEFVKWMSYSAKGWDWRVTHENYVNLPTINDPKVWQDVFKEKAAPAGLQNVLPLIPNGFMDGTRWYPGFNTVADLVWDYYQKFNANKARPEDVAPALQAKAQAAYNKSLAAIKAGIAKFYSHGK